MARDDSLRGALIRSLVMSIGLSLLVAAMFTVRDGFAGFFVSWAISMMYSFSIGLTAMLVFRRLRPRLRTKSELAQWLTYFGVGTAVTGFGTLVTGLAIVACGWVPIDEFWTTYLSGFRIAILIAIPTTIGAASFSQLHRRLAEREAELGAKELEHQRALALATEAKLASLESRIRPHFLFNALNSAIALIPEDPRRAEQVLERLAALLRFSLDSHAARLVTLGEELRIVRDYLEIERVRFGERLRYEVDVPEALAALHIPAFAVQTLVENSVKYAVSPNKAGAAIRVRARREDDRLVIEVSDDGPGFAGEIWRAGHGLDGLRARLDTLYGADAQLVAPAPAATGAAVVIGLPADTREAAA